MSAIKKVYDFELSSSVYPVMMEVDLSGSTGFYVADENGTAAAKNSLGYYDITDENTKYCLYIDETVSPGTYTFPVVLAQVSGPENDQTIWRSDGDTSKGHNVPSFGNVDGQLDSETNEIGPFIILEDSFSLVDNLVGDLHISFDSIEACAGGCDSENKFITYDEDGFSHINNVFTLTRQGEKACDCSEITWSYTGFTYPVPEGEPEPAVLSEFISGTGYGVREPVVYERDYGNGPTGDPLYDCDCDDASSAGYAYVTVTLTKNSCCMNEAGDGVEKLGEGCKDQDGNDLPADELWDTLKVAYGTSDGGSGIFYQEWCSDDMYNELNGIAFPNDRQSCDVSSSTDKIIAKNGQVYIEFQDCGECGGYYNNTPTPKASCTATHTITPTSSSTHTPTSTHSATPSDSHTPTATVPPSGTSGILIGITPCSYNGDGEVPIQAYLFDVNGGATVPSTSIKLGGECFTTEFIYPISTRVQDAPVIEIQEDGTPKYTEQGNYGAVKRRARNNQPIFQAHQNIWNNLTSMHVHADWAEIDADFAFFDDCPACEATPTETASASVTPTASNTPTPTATDTPTQTISATPSATESATTTPTESATGSASATLTASATQTLTPTSTDTPTESASVTQTPSPTATEVYDSATSTGDATPTSTALCPPCLKGITFSGSGWTGPSYLAGTWEEYGTFGGKPYWRKAAGGIYSYAYIYWNSGTSAWECSYALYNDTSTGYALWGQLYGGGGGLETGSCPVTGSSSANFDTASSFGYYWTIEVVDCPTTTESATPTATDSGDTPIDDCCDTIDAWQNEETYTAGAKVCHIVEDGYGVSNAVWVATGTSTGQEPPTEPPWTSSYWRLGTASDCETSTATPTATDSVGVEGDCDTDGESAGPVEAWDNTTTYNATTGTDGVVCYNGLAYRCVQTHNLGADVGGAVIPGTDTDYWVRASSHDYCCASVTATPTVTDATGDEGGGGDSECCGCTTSVYAMQACGSSDTIFVFGNSNASQEDNTYNSSSPYIIIGSLDESILCEPFCARFVSHTAGGTPYGPGEDISLDHSSASYVVLSDSAVEAVTNGGTATTYADCTACQNDCDNC